MARTRFRTSLYDLEATLDSGQAFRWRASEGGWEGILGMRWVRLVSAPDGIEAETVADPADWSWLRLYLQTDLNLAEVMETFPDDPPMRQAVHACAGLRLLRQDPWECLASFILSSTKQIVQIKQIVELLCQRFGAQIKAPHGKAAFTFPSAENLAQLSEQELRACKMGFRAPYLLGTARMVAAGEIDLEKVRGLDVESARAELMRLPGVGRKIADCVLLFGYGFQQAFPVDVWVMKALKQLYFPGKKPSPKRLQSFSQTHFGPNAGYAQQYLFHYMRTKHV